MGEPELPRLQMIIFKLSLCHLHTKRRDLQGHCWFTMATATTGQKEPSKGRKEGSAQIPGKVVPIPRKHTRIPPLHYPQPASHFFRPTMAIKPWAAEKLFSTFIASFILFLAKNEKFPSLLDGA